MSSSISSFATKVWNLHKPKAMSIGDSKAKIIYAKPGEKIKAAFSWKASMKIADRQARVHTLHSTLMKEFGEDNANFLVEKITQGKAKNSAKNIARYGIESEEGTFKLDKAKATNRINTACYVRDYKIDFSEERLKDVEDAVDTVVADAGIDPNDPVTADAYHRLVQGVVIKESLIDSYKKTETDENRTPSTLTIKLINQKIIDIFGPDPGEVPKSDKALLDKVRELDPRVLGETLLEAADRITSISHKELILKAAGQEFQALALDARTAIIEIFVSSAESGAKEPGTFLRDNPGPLQLEGEFQGQFTDRCKGELRIFGSLRSTISSLTVKARAVKMRHLPENGNELRDKPGFTPYVCEAVEKVIRTIIGTEKNPGANEMSKDFCRYMAIAAERIDEYSVDGDTKTALKRSLVGNYLLLRGVFYDLTTSGMNKVVVQKCQGVLTTTTEYKETNAGLLALNTRLRDECNDFFDQVIARGVTILAEEKLGTAVQK
jgi:hypothetical protein